jgi:hypothetical protein
MSDIVPEAGTCETGMQHCHIALPTFYQYPRAFYSHFAASAIPPDIQAQPDGFRRSVKRGATSSSGAFRHPERLLDHSAADFPVNSHFSE